MAHLPVQPLAAQLSVVWIGVAPWGLSPGTMVLGRGVMGCKRMPVGVADRRVTVEFSLRCLGIWQPALWLVGTGELCWGPGAWQPHLLPHNLRPHHPRWSLMTHQCLRTQPVPAAGPGPGQVSWPRV